MAALKKIAFTLAEVLIVIGIIGIVAEMVVPDLIISTQNQTYVTGLQKAYNETTNVLNQIASDGGCISDLSCSGMYDAGTDSTSAGQTLSKYFKVAKTCGTSSQQCWANQTNWNYDGSSGTNTNYNTNGYYTFVTTDGMSFAINSNSSPTVGCTTASCGNIAVDVNGIKKPNTLGRDTFLFIIYTKPNSGSNINSIVTAYGQLGIYPWNLGGANHCSTSDKSGWYCAGRIMEKGWTMDY